MTAVLRAEGLAFGYPGQPALFEGWSAAVGPGLTLLYGDMGSGKSTLARLLAGELPPAAGRLVLAGCVLAQDAEGYRRRVFLVGAQPEERFAQSTVRACAQALCGADWDAPRWEAWAEGLGLAPHLDKALYMLSTGSRRKVWLAAALAARRPLTMLDEPAAGLDAASLRFLWPALAEMGRDGGRAVVVASSDPEALVAAVALSGRIDLPPPR